MSDLRTDARNMTGVLKDVLFAAINGRSFTEGDGDAKGTSKARLHGENALMPHGNRNIVGILRLLLSRDAPSESLRMTRLKGTLRLFAALILS